MSSAGKLLQEERITQNRTLAGIASKTCISRRYLEAVEDDNPKALPGHFFYRSYIKQYAQALNLNDETTRAILAAAISVEEVDPLPALSLAYKTARIEGRLSGRYRPRTGAAVALLGLALVGCSGLYAVWHNAQVAKETSIEPAAVQPRRAAEATPAWPAVTHASQGPAPR